MATTSFSYHEFNPQTACPSSTDSTTRKNVRVTTELSPEAVQFSTDLLKDHMVAESEIHDQGNVRVTTELSPEAVQFSSDLLKDHMVAESEIHDQDNVRVTTELSPEAVQFSTDLLKDHMVAESEIHDQGNVRVTTELSPDAVQFSTDLLKDHMVTESEIHDQDNVRVTTELSPEAVQFSTDLLKDHMVTESEIHGQENACIILEPKELLEICMRSTDNFTVNDASDITEQGQSHFCEHNQLWCDGDHRNDYDKSTPSRTLEEDGHRSSAGLDTEDPQVEDECAQKISDNDNFTKFETCYFDSTVNPICCDDAAVQVNQLGVECLPCQENQLFSASTRTNVGHNDPTLEVLDLEDCDIEMLSESGCLEESEVCRGASSPEVATFSLAKISSCISTNTDKVCTVGKRIESCAMTKILDLESFEGTEHGGIKLSVSGRLAESKVLDLESLEQTENCDITLSESGRLEESEVCRGASSPEVAAFSLARLSSLITPVADKVCSDGKQTESCAITESVFTSKIVPETQDSINSTEQLLNSHGTGKLDLMSDLPVEIVLLIFSFFSPQELGRCIAPVCKQWKTLAYDPILWQVLTLDFNQYIHLSVLCNIFKRATLLKKLSLHGRKDLTLKESQVIADNCHLLQNLDLGFCDSVNLAIVSCISEQCLALEKVNVEGCHLIDHSCIKRLCCLPKLTSLNVSHCTLLEDESIIYLADNLACIKSLNADGLSWITDNTVEFLIRQHSQNLEWLYLDGAELSDLAFKDLPNCERLCGFLLSFAELVTDHLLWKLKCLPNLVNLRLKKGQEFTPVGLAELFGNSGLRNLKVIDLSECNELTDVCVTRLAQSCKSSLERLSLCWCWNVSDVGLEAIVSNCSQLLYLDLLGIDKITGTCLQDIPTKMPRLMYLDLRQCHRIDDELVLEVFKAKQDLTILNYYGEEFSLDSTCI